jgi:predicted negative regulator of RcsB-dependent stress response
LEHLRKANAMEQDPEVAAHFGEVLWVSGKREEARRVWRDAVKNFPDDERLKNVIEKFTPTLR